MVGSWMQTCSTDEHGWDTSSILYPKFKVVPRKQHSKVPNETISRHVYVFYVLTVLMEKHKNFSCVKRQMYTTTLKIAFFSTTFIFLYKAHKCSFFHDNLQATQNCIYVNNSDSFDTFKYFSFIVYLGSQNCIYVNYFQNFP